MGWQAHLRLHYRREAERTLGHAEHEGPLRVLKALYPEGPGICHHVLLHPPSGLVSGDELNVDIDLAEGSHVVLTTPGATRFYRSSGAPATQQVRARVAADARLEWLPQENLIYNAAQAVNQQHFELAPGAMMIGWDVLALGLPAADLPFAQGRVTQHLALSGVGSPGPETAGAGSPPPTPTGLWLDRAVIDASDQRLLDSPLGWAGRRALGTMWLAWGKAPAEVALLQAVDAAREAIAELDGTAITPAPATPVDAAISGLSAVHPQVVVLRVLAPRVEPIMRTLTAVRRAWRSALWGAPALDLRLWRT